MSPDLCPACWAESMPFVMQLACRLYRFSPEEALLAATAGGAGALGLADRGVLAPDRLADLQVWDVPAFEHVIYRLGADPVVIKPLVLIHGESDAGNTNYESEMLQLWKDYNADLRAVTGQKRDILMIVSQHHSFADRSPSTQAQWRIGVDNPEFIVCSGPKYQYHSVEGVHLTSECYRQLGEKIGEIYYERVVLGKNWQPLEPTSVERQGTNITIHFHVPVPPLVWDTGLDTPHPSVEEWKNGKEFEVTTAGGEKVTILSAAISGDAVKLHCASDPGPGARVGYAMVGEKRRMSTPFRGFYRWGLLRDSDPFEGVVSGVAQPNFAVAFELPVP